MTALVSWLWQGLALAAAMAVLLRVARPLSAATRYALWWATLAAVLALPFVPALTGVAPAAGPASSPMPLAAGAPLVEPLVPVALPAPAEWLVALAIGVWLGFLLLGALSLWRAARHLSMLRRGARPVSAALEARLPLWRAVRRSGRAVTLAVSDDVAAPAALGLGRPMVVLPRGLVGRLGDDEVDQIVLHEYGHLRRRDDWARLAQAIIQAVVWFHPAVWWIDRQLELEREAACDDFVVRQTGAARRYAACLARAAEITGSPAPAGTLAPGMAGSRRVLLTRVRRLLDGRVSCRAPGLAAMALVVGSVTLAAGVGALAQAPPLVAVAAPFTLYPPAVAGPTAGTWPTTAVLAPLAVPAITPEVRRTVPADEPGPEARALPTAALRLADADRLELPGVAVPPPAYSAPAAPALEASPLVAALQPVAAPASRLREDGVATAGSEAAGPWDKVAGTGASVGSGFKKAGVATAGFFTRLSRSIASSF